MRQFKKKTIALVLASVVTVVGSFAAEKYKNSLMSLGFEKLENGTVNMLVKTRSAYEGSVSPIRKDANTYVLMLPEIDSQASTPLLEDVSGDIQSVNIRTMPYSANGNGYTRITVKTYHSINLQAKNLVYLPGQDPDIKSIAENSTQNGQKEYLNNNATEHSLPATEESEPVSEDNIEQANEYHSSVTEEEKSTVSQPQDALGKKEDSEFEEAIDINTETNSQNSDTYEKFLLLLGILLVITISIYLYIKASNKLTEIAGEKININIDDKKEKEKEKEKSKKSIRKTVGHLDSKYPKTALTASNAYNATQPEAHKIKASEEPNVVDLDEIFQEQIKSKTETTDEEAENQALEDFLSGFFYTEDEEPSNADADPFDEETYQNVIKSNFKFSANDVECINKLLNIEIIDETLKKIEEYAISNPIKKKPTKKQIIEELVTTYKISRDITFHSDDLKILSKLISVELDSDFVHDLRTNPIRLTETEAELKQGSQSKKTSEILTLNVKDMLPDISDALAKQGNRAIESNYKPDTVYYTEGYNVSILSSKDLLPDLSVEIGKKESYVSKPSAAYELVDNSYEVERLIIEDSLPDLKDVIANPEKYAEPNPEPIIVDEEKLLNNIKDVHFKPFYDGSQTFEIINKDINEDFEQNDNTIKTNAAPVLETAPIVEQEVAEALPEKEKKKDADTSIAKNEKTEALMQRIQAAKERRKSTATQNIKNNNKPNVKETTKCIFDGESYSVLSSVVLSDNKGCHLVKNGNGYTVMAYIGDKVYKIKEYKILKSEKIQARFNEKTANGNLRYIIRIGINKFVVDVNETINYVMDLC